MLTKNLLVLKKTLLGLAVGWTILLAVLCLISFRDLPTIRVQSADKYVHFSFHFVFTLLWGLYVSLKYEELLLNKISSIVGISVGYGILIEILQETLTTTRHADVFDVIANLVGALVASGVLLLIKKKKTLNH